MDESHVSAEIDILIEAIRNVGEALPIGASDGTHKITFGKLYVATEDTLEALNGTLRAAKKRGVIHFKKQMLLKGVDDAQEIYIKA